MTAEVRHERASPRSPGRAVILLPWGLSRIVRAMLPSVVLALMLGGCVHAPKLLSRDEQRRIDRSLVEYPTGFELKPYIRDLTAPTAFCFDDHNSLIIAQGERGEEPTIFGYKTDGSLFYIYPEGRRLPFGLPTPGWKIYGPIGGMVFYQGRLYISHRDENDLGVITALDYKGHHTTIVAGLPAQGDFGVTDLAITNGRLYFGVGTATNSGVVGNDNFGVWVKNHPKCHDESWHALSLLGYRFDTPNPFAGLFGPAEIAVTAPFQPFNQSNQTRVLGVEHTTGKPNGAIYWVSPQGGPVTVEAHGIHLPRGIVVNEYGRIYFTNDGMEMRGTRPVKDDPDALLRLVPGTWYGWPDYTADLNPVTDSRFQPPVDLIDRTGYPEVRFLIDQEGSHLFPPNKDTLVQGAFPSLSGAARIDVTPSTGPFKEFRGNVIVALQGDRAPFATSGRKLNGPSGYKVVRVDPDTHQVKDFIRNTNGGPGSAIARNPDLIERPVDVKFAPDGSLYVLDYGKMQMRDGKERIDPGTGQVFRLVPTAPITETHTNRIGVLEK